MKPDALKELLLKALGLTLKAGVDLLIEQVTSDNNTVLIVEV